MKRILLVVGILVVCLMAINPCCAANPVPKGFGVNIHFTGAPAKDLDLIQEAGFDMARTDLKWGRIEKSRGQYDWTQYDQLINGLISRGITPYLILDYNNQLYGAGHELDGISTSQQIEAYTNFAKAAVQRYKGKKIIWEIWNEPNLGVFWRPSPHAGNYMNLVKSAVPAMRAADPNVVIVAPGVAFIANTFDYIKECARLGLFNYIDGLSVHPYKNDAPENGHIQYLYSALRDILRQYGKGDMPIVGGEFGFSEVWSKVNNEQTQAEFLARQLILHDQLNIPVSIVYEFKDSGTDPGNTEHNFGILRNDYSKKPGFNAIKTLRNELKGWNYSRKLSSNSNDYLFEYTNGSAKKVAAWTTGSSHSVTIYGKSVNLTKLPTYVSDGVAPPPPTDPPSDPDCPATAPVINSVQLAFKESTGTHYAVINWEDNSEMETGFDIYQSVGNTSNFQKVNSLNVLEGVRTLKVMLKIDDPQPNTYYYKIVANYSCGKIEESNVESIVIKATKPSAPESASGFGSVSTGDKNVAVLKWIDSSNNEDGFNVYHSTSQTGTFEKVGTVRKDCTSIVHWLGSSTGAHYYQVKAFNADGESASASTVQININ